MKENINSIDEAASIDVIKKLEPKTYNYKSDLEKKECVGFIAQDVMKISPNSVEAHDNQYAQVENMLTLNLNDLFTHNVNATKNILTRLEVVEKLNNIVPVKEIDYKQIIEKQQLEIDDLKATLKRVMKFIKMK